MSDKKTILVVEDDTDSRTALCFMLERLGYAHISFESAQETLDAIEGENINNIDLCLLDIMMPGMNGYELLDKLKTLEAFEDTPCIMVTAKNQDEEVIEGYQHGADYYITKPYTISQLQYGINICLEGGEED